MDLLLWRHAEAVDADNGSDDASRELTKKGRRQARKMADWLSQQLPESARVYSSPAKRCFGTASELDRKLRVMPELSIDRQFAAALAAVGWPEAGGTILLVGHQPMLGEMLAHCLGMPAASCNVKKGSLWWLRRHEKEGVSQISLLTVQTPEML